MPAPGRRAIGAATLVAALILALGMPPVALAAPGAPSWDDVLDAKGDVAATERAIASIETAVRGLEAQYADAARTALERGEQLQLATAALDEATLSLESLERRRDAALARADESSRTAAQLATQLARAGGGDITTALLVSGTEADDLLYTLGTMSAVSSRTDAVITRAVQDRNTAASLTAQADLARDARASLARDAELAATQADAAARTAEARVAEQEAQLQVLAEQLSTLTGRSAALEREYLDSLGGGGGGAGGGGAGGGGPNDGDSGNGNGDSGSGGGGTGGSPSPGPSAPAPSPSAPAPSPSAPAPSPSAPSPSPSPSSPGASTPQPNATIVNAAIAYARAQLGEPYAYGGRGPNSWDCSGLTMMAYSSAGRSIGGHSVTMQYNQAAARGQLVPYSQAKPGDLIFYSSNGLASGSKYHVAMYIGGGQMIEAPSPGKTVRIVTVRNGDRINVVARPSA